MWWSSLQRRRPTLRPDGTCTLVEVDDLDAPVAAPSPPAAPSALDELRATALLAARMHSRGPAVTGAAAAAAVLQRLTGPTDSRRYQAWLLQGLYHRMAVAEAHRSRHLDALARAHELRARSVLRLAATSPDRMIARRARTALLQLAARSA